MFSVDLWYLNCGKDTVFPLLFYSVRWCLLHWQWQWINKNSSGGSTSLPKPTHIWTCRLEVFSTAEGCWWFSPHIFRPQVWPKVMMGSIGGGIWCQECCWHLWACAMPPLSFSCDFFWSSDGLHWCWKESHGCKWKPHAFEAACGKMQWFKMRSFGWVRHFIYIYIIWMTLAPKKKKNFSTS